MPVSRGGGDPNEWGPTESTGDRSGAEKTWEIDY